jgi:antitoxin FitA
MHAYRLFSMHGAIIRRVPNVQVRGVPEDVHRRLRAQAALAGQSLNEFLLARITEIARVPTLGELAQRIRERSSYTGPSSAAVIREARERR